MTNQVIFLKKIKDFLLAKNLLEEDKLEMIEDEVRRGRDLEDVFASRKIFSSEKFLEIKKEIFNLEIADLTEIVILPEVLNLLTLKVAQNYQMVIFDRQDKVIKVGLVKPGDFQAYEAIEFLCQQHGLEADYFVISLRDFKKVIKQYGGFKKEIGSVLEVAKEKFAKQEELVSVQSDEDLERAIKTAPVAKIVSVIIKHAVEGGASDIHIEPSRTENQVRYRVDGVLHTSIRLPGYLHSAIISRIKVLANLKLDETRLPQDGRIRVEVDGQEIDLRVSVLPLLNEEKVVMRVLDTSAGVPTLAELGFSERDIEIIERNIRKPHGMFLLTGPTGSGKTTTLYAILNMLNGEGVNITTLEDPVEYYINSVNQSQINPEIGFSFAQGLRSILRQDPNIIMVGEIRDNETVELVIHASLTGHLVFSTLHTNNAWGAIPRLMDMKAEPFLLSSTLNLIMAQRLVRKICPDCKEEFKLPVNLEKKIKVELDKMLPDSLSHFGGKFKFYRGRGCATCGQSGYVSRTVVGEVLEVGPKLREIISRDFTFEEAQNQLKEQGFLTLIQDGMIKALNGVTTVEEIMRVAQES